jgi:hypothetical protein
MSRSRRGAWALSASIVLLLPLSACSAVPDLPEPWQYNCTWTSDKDGQFQLSSYAHATYSVSRTLLSQSVSSTDVAGDGELVGEGRWMLGNGVLLRDETGLPAITILLSVNEGERAWRLVVVGSGSDLRLVAPTPDPDDPSGVSFEPSDCFDPGL